MKQSQISFLGLLVFLCLPFFTFAQDISEKKAVLEQIIRDDSRGVVKNDVDSEGGIDSSLRRVSIKKVDLNNDGHPELIVDLDYLGSSKNTRAFYIYRKSANKYDLLLEGNAWTHRTLRTKTNAYNDIRSVAYSASETFIHIYKFESGRYKAKCWTREAYPGTRIKIVPQKCEQ